MSLNTHLTASNTLGGRRAWVTSVWLAQPDWYAIGESMMCLPYDGVLAGDPHTGGMTCQYMLLDGDHWSHHLDANNHTAA